MSPSTHASSSANRYAVSDIGYETSEACSKHAGAPRSSNLQEAGVRVRTLVLTKGGKPADPELRRQIAADLMPDVVSAEDAIGATHVDEHYFAALPGLRGCIFRRLPMRVAQLLEVRMRGRQYDAVLTWGDKPAIVVAALMLLWRRRPAHVAILFWPSKPKKAIPLRCVQRGIDRFVVCSPVQRQFLLEQLGMPAERLVDVRGRRIDTHFWRLMSCEPVDQICSVGQEMRDYETLREALEPLGIRCHVAAGTGILGTTSPKWWRDSLERRDLPQGLTIGKKSFVDLREMYAQSRFVVVPLMPSDHDNGVTTILEAFAMGKAVICTDTLGQVGVLEDGVNCLRVPPHDAVALREAIQELWNDPQKCRRLGDAGRELVLEQHGIDRWTATLMRAVDEAIAVRTFPS